MASLMEKLKKGRALFAGKKPMLPEETGMAAPMPIEKPSKAPQKSNFKTKKPVKNGK